MGVRGKGSAFETPCPAQHCRGKRPSRAFAPREIGWMIYIQQASRCHEFPGPTPDVFQQCLAQREPALFPERDAQMPSGTSRLYYKPFAETEPPAPRLKEVDTT